MMAAPKATEDNKNRNQYKRAGLFDVVMLENVFAKIG
jgi:hypothetical protein